MSATAELCLERHYDAARINELANHPAIRPTCGGDGKSQIDLTAFVADPKNHAMVWDRGYLLAVWTGPQTYEIHVAVLPEGRGRDAYRMVAEFVAYMAEHGAERLWARVAEHSDGLRHYTAQAGFTRCDRDAIDIGFGPVTYDIYQWKAPCRQH
jgi:hypothetical protein